MINLLPTDYKQSLHYARLNSQLLRWFSGLLCLGIVVASTLFVGQMYLVSETERYRESVAQSNQELKDLKLEETQEKIQAISGNLKLIVQVLSRQVIFSQLIQQIGVVMPAQAVLSDIEISKVEGGIDLTAQAKDYQTATQIQVNLTDPANKLFDKADIVSVKCEGDSEYPCTIELRALFTNKNPYLFVNQGGQQ